MQNSLMVLELILLASGIFTVVLVFVQSRRFNQERNRLKAHQ